MRRAQKRGKFQQLKEAIRKFTNFIGRRHIWSGLAAGFLWAFSAPFVLTALSSSFKSLPDEVMWTVFFPLESSYWLTRWIAYLGVDSMLWVLVLIVSMFVGMFSGMVFTYFIHRIRVYRRKRNISLKTPSE